MPQKQKPQFARGDQVRLRNAGPVMTIEDFREHMAYCVWVADGRMQESMFHQRLLNLVRQASHSPAHGLAHLP